MRVGLTVNGSEYEVDVEPRRTLLDLLRLDLGLTGTHAGCEQGACGSCTVTLDGDVIRSCLVLAVQCAGRSVTTIEGLGEPGRLHPVQEAFHRHHALQCGYCTPGMVLAARSLLDGPGPLDEETVREALAGNLCRCTGYSNIVAAVLAAAEERG
jgi:carbon-monoxide dehydrogenase small subunit